MQITQFATHALHRHLDLIQIPPDLGKTSIPSSISAGQLAQIQIERDASSNRNAVHFLIYPKRTRQTTPHALFRQCTARAPTPVRAPVQNVHTATAEHKIDTEHGPRREFYRHCIPDVKSGFDRMEKQINGLFCARIPTRSPPSSAGIQEQL